MKIRGNGEKNKDTVGPSRDRERDSGYRKAAEFLMIIGKDQASSVLKHLNEKEVQGITAEISQIERIDRREADKILEEFGYLAKSSSYLSTGGSEKAKEILENAFGQEKAAAIIAKLRYKIDYRPFEFLEDLHPDQVILLLKGESAPVVSLIISHLNPATAARILESFPEKMQKEIARRIARMNEVTPEVLYSAEESLREKVRAQGQVITQDIDGESALAAIMKHLDMETENFLINSITERDPELGESLKQKLFDIDVVFRIRDQDLAAILRDFEDEEIALILKGKHPDFTERILGSVSSRRREMIKMEYEAAGKVLKSETNKATLEFMNYIRQQAEKGDLYIVDRDDELVR